jgi:CheY-like chemotaxis protein
MSFGPSVCAARRDRPRHARDGRRRAFADALRENRPELPVLFVSGYAQDALSERGVLRHDVELLTKPFTPAAMQARGARDERGGSRRSCAPRTGEPLRTSGIRVTAHDTAGIYTDSPTSDGLIARLVDRL